MLPVRCWILINTKSDLLIVYHFIFVSVVTSFYAIAQRYGVRGFSFNTEDQNDAMMPIGGGCKTYFVSLKFYSFFHFLTQQSLIVKEAKNKRVTCHRMCDITSVFVCYLQKKTKIYTVSTSQD